MAMVRMFSARCETCGTGEQYFSQYAKAVIIQLRNAGWRLRSKEFYCPDCRIAVDKRGKKSDAESL